MNNLTAKPPGKRLQHRVSLDPAMGPLYEWLCSLDPKTRTREVTYLLRLGGEVHLGTRSIAVGSVGVPLPNLAVSSTAKTVPSQGPETALAAMADWNLLQMSTPPRRS